jgi:hypothetical protein
MLRPALPTIRRARCVCEGAGPASRSSRERWGRGRMVGSWAGQRPALTCAGVTVLRFGHQGQVVEHRDCYNHVERREPPYAGR